MRIGDLANRTGVSVRSLRYYEEQGLLQSTRTGTGHRRYVDDDVNRVLFLQRLYAAGLSSRTIAEVLPCVDTPSTQASEAAFQRLVQERERIDTQIADLTATREALDVLIRSNRRSRATA
jgi:DNA-binding transcriptional MerR regulator